jgi:hypothetical protein
MYLAVAVLPEESNVSAIAVAGSLLVEDPKEEVQSAA